MTPSTTLPDAATIRREHERYIFPCVRPYYDEPIVVAEASGVRVTDADGREYLDLFAGILTTSVGHCHPEVVSRIQEQVARLGHTSTLYLTEGQVAVAKRLAELAPGRLERTFFTNSGTEAVENAVMLACIHTGRSEVVALRYAYSGRSHLTMSLTGHAPWRPVSGGVAGVRHALSPYSYRSPWGNLPEEEQAELFARDLEETILTTTNGRPAAVLIETIQGVGGYIVPPQGYFQRVAEIVRKYGALLIIDEVQTAFGRTGGKWFGIEHWEVEPDIMVMAKGIANGFPVGATMTRDEIARSWTGKTISTYGGNPVAMAAAGATLDVMVREDAPARAEARGRQLREGLDALAAEYPWIGQVRGMGLMQAMELVVDPISKTPDPARAKALMEATRHEGLLAGVGGLHGQVVRFGPSLLVTEVEIAEGLERLARACATAHRAT